MSLLEELHSFYRESVPSEFNRTFFLQQKLAKTDASAESLLAEMQAVRASIRVDVGFRSEISTHWLEIDRGEMRVVSEPSLDPFFILAHDLDHFPNLQRHFGASILGFLGALTGQRSAMKLTSKRVRSLRALKGSLIIEVGDPGGFSLVASFGVLEPERPPRSRIRLDAELFEALESGVIDAQEAFLDERIEVDGDLELAIGMALAAFAND